MQSSTASATTRATASAETRRHLLHHLSVSHSRVSPLVYQLPWQLSYSAPNYSFRVSNSKLLCRPESRDPVADTIADFRSRLKGNNGSIIGGDDDDDFGWEGLKRSSRWKTKQKKQGRRTWWSDNEHLEDDDEEGPSNLWEEFVDSIWIWKVIESYGWFSPLIISSMLLVSGPKAFLIALAIPLGQSTLTFILNKIGVAPLAPLFSNNTRPRGNKRRTHSNGRFYYDDLAEDDADIEEEDGWFKSPKMRKKKKKKRNSGGYQSWVAAAEAATRKRRMNNGSVSNKSGNSSGGSKSSSFGGWDDLIMVDGEESNTISNKETKTSRREHESAETTSKHNKEWRENGTDSFK